MTITDLLRGQTGNGPTTIPVSAFMTKAPVTVAADDNCAVAATVLREYRLKSLPIVETANSRKLVGCLRLRRLMAYVMKESGGRS